MRLLTQTLVDTYIKDDWIARELASNDLKGALTMDGWLLGSAAKRAVFASLYGDLILSEVSLDVLDVGGGISSLTSRLAQSSRYLLMDMLAHGGREVVRALEMQLGRTILIENDWYYCIGRGEVYDIVIANDLFPNVDQRLELFIERVLPVSSEIRLSLTFYNAPRFYICQRVDASEYMCLLAWSGDQTAAALRRFSDRIIKPDFSIFEDTRASLFSNGRQIILVTLRGDRRD